MRIALINENSQAPKNALIYKTLNDVAGRFGHNVDNYGMYSQEDKAWLTYVQNGILASVLINSGAADFIVTGCGTGVGAMLACNSFPGVICGLAVEPSDAFLFLQINNGNAISLPYAKGFGWGAELNMAYIFEKLFEGEPGGGYPPEKQKVERENKGILDQVKKNNFKDIIECLEGLDTALVEGAMSGGNFKSLFYQHATDEKLIRYVKSIVGE
ncbi:MAG: RpiB/LacA/LacB family sugar-phosphate isomerase [Anaerolineales bacterium]|nr:MAG: RpiB/LacA/LacB family sugar-phosphate isomerase [Anaerolineales bacterium]